MARADHGAPVGAAGQWAMHRNAYGLLVSTALLCLGLVACGGSSTGGDHSTGSAGAKSAATNGGATQSGAAKTRTVALAPFCDKLDAAATAKVLGVPSVRLTVDLKPGQRFAPIPGGKKTATAASYECTLSTPTSGLAPDRRSVYLSASLAGPPPASTTFQKLADQQYQAASQGARCARHPVTGWGDTTDSWTCTVSQGYYQVIDSRRAQFGTTRFGCSLDIAGDRSARLQTVTAAADKLCNDLLTKVSS